MLESYHKLQQKPKTVPKFKNAFDLIWPALPEKAIQNAVKDHRKRLHCRHVCQPAVNVVNILCDNAFNRH